VNIELSSGDESFTMIMRWFAEKNSNPNKKNFMLSTTRTGSPTDSKPRLLFAPGNGNHYFQYRGKWIKLERIKDAKPRMTLNSETPLEHIRLSMFGQDAEVLQKFCLECLEYSLQKEEGMVSIFTPDQWNCQAWLVSLTKPKRSIHSVVLEGNQSQRVMDDIKVFIESVKWYQTRGLPHRRGYLLYGPPGNGKSSFIFALASAMNLNICCLSLNESSLTDTKLAGLMRSAPARSLILLEDIDCVFEGRKSTTRTKVTYTGLLNAIDGVAAQEGSLLFVTTNHKEKLNSALIRPGRIDVQEYFGLASENQIQRLFQVFYPTEPEDSAKRFASLIPKNTISMASLQGFFLINRDTPLKCFEGVEQLIEDEKDRRIELEKSKDKEEKEMENEKDAKKEEEKEN